MVYIVCKYFFNLSLNNRVVVIYSIILSHCCLCLDGDDTDDDADDDDGWAGTTFLCSVLIAPVKNENNDVILFILNLEDITDAPVKTDVHRQSARKLGMIYTIQGPDYKKILRLSYDAIIVSQTCDKVKMFLITKTSYDNLTRNFQ